MPQQMQQPVPPQGPQQGMYHQQMPAQPQEFMKAGMQDAMASVGLDGGVGGMVADQAIKQAQAQFQASGLQGWFPTFFLSLQQLFNVGHAWVLRKLLLLLCPFLKRSQGAPPSNASWGDGVSPSGNSKPTGQDGLKIDVEEPDLYIPSMAYVTYLIVYGVQRGMISDFHPEVLSSTASFAFVLLVLEVGVAKMGFYIAGSSVPALEIMANCGYKYVPVVLMVTIRIVTGGNPMYYAFFAYFAACAAWTTRRFMLHWEPSQLRQQYGQAPSKLHTHII